VGAGRFQTCLTALFIPFGGLEINNIDGPMAQTVEPSKRKALSSSFRTAKQNKIKIIYSGSLCSAYCLHSSDSTLNMGYLV
jgi:hypothetical protein